LGVGLLVGADFSLDAFATSGGGAGVETVCALAVETASVVQIATRRKVE
jgi:hypothetical protein